MRTLTPPLTDEVIDLTTAAPPAADAPRAPSVVGFLTIWLTALGSVTFLWWSTAGWG